MANLESSLSHASFTYVLSIYLTTPKISKCKDVTDIVAAIGSNDQANDDYDLATNDVKPVNDNVAATNEDIFANDE